MLRIEIRIGEMNRGGFVMVRDSMLDLPPPQIGSLIQIPGTDRRAEVDGVILVLNDEGSSYYNVRALNREIEEFQAKTLRGKVSSKWLVSNL